MKLHDQHYLISKRFAPPACDLRCGRLCDDHGSTASAKLSISHLEPNDVQLEHLEYYYDVFNFLSPPDIIFYVYPVFRFYSNPRTEIVLDNFIRAMIRFSSSIQALLNQTEIATLRELIESFYQASLNDAWSPCVQNNWELLDEFRSSYGCQVRHAEECEQTARPNDEERDEPNA